MEKNFQKHFKDKEAVVLFNFGAPDDKYNLLGYRIRLFSDPEILSFPKSRILRIILAFMISIVSLKRTKRKYDSIGGRSPLNEISEKQRSMLERELNRSSEGKYKVYLSMLYSGPTIDETLANISREEIRKITFLPLFPHFSKVTTGSYYKKLEKIIGNYDFEYKMVESYYDNPIFIDAWKNKIIRRFNSAGENTVLVFSAHGIPEKCIQNGDPYMEQVQKSVTKIYQKLNTSLPYYITYQSRMAFGKWLGPSTSKTLRKLASLGRDVVFVPISFVADNFETKYEADIELANIYKKSGGSRFQRIDSLNDDLIFTKCLVNLIERV